MWKFKVLLSVVISLGVWSSDKVFTQPVPEPTHLSSADFMRDLPRRPSRAKPTTTTTTTTEVPDPLPELKALLLEVSEFEAKMFIYNHESGNNPAKYNSDGCRGLGQACPGSKLPCSDTDYECQDAWFTGYMQDRYGTWNEARKFWISKAEPCGKDNTDWCGGWW